MLTTLFGVVAIDTFLAIEKHLPRHPFIRVPGGERFTSTVARVGMLALGLINAPAATLYPGSETALSQPQRVRQVALQQRHRVRNDRGMAVSSAASTGQQRCAGGDPVSLGYRVSAGGGGKKYPYQLRCIWCARMHHKEKKTSFKCSECGKAYCVGSNSSSSTTSCFAKHRHRGEPAAGSWKQQQQ
jgi:hypothetical protein